MLNQTGRYRGKERLSDPTPELIEKWASEGVPRSRMASLLGISQSYLKKKMQSRELIRAELRGKLKFYE